jgi:hypothetical protein
MKHGLNLVGISLPVVSIARDVSLLTIFIFIFIFASAARSTDEHLSRLH